MPIKRKCAPPELCTCGRKPVLVKMRGMGYLIACPGVSDCPNCETSGWWSTEEEAVGAWDRKIADLKGRKKAKK